jgi:5-(carboxyamino)imidazole ribonucleotide synthase
MTIKTGTPLAPNQWIAMIGGGQLGRMFCFAAHALGYRVCVLDPDADSPAGRVADHHLQADYQDAQALAWIAEHCQAATTEFENVPATVLEALAMHMPVRPGAHAVAIAQDRIAEKTFLREAGVDTASFAAIHTEADCDAAPEALFPGILKSARLGYDGKGQVRVENRAQLRDAFVRLNRCACVLEQLLPLAGECSVVLARDSSGAMVCFDVLENHHEDGILASTVMPARLPLALGLKAQAMAQVIAAKLEYVGVLCVEFFVLADGRLVANEMAPRPHNSGHLTIEACAISQFEQQVRAVAGLPLGAAAAIRPAVMLNVLGDAWRSGEPDWIGLMSQPHTHLHLYSKASARGGRKMGHITITGASLGEALSRARHCAQTLGLPVPQ